MFWLIGVHTSNQTNEGSVRNSNKAKDEFRHFGGDGRGSRATRIIQWADKPGHAAVEKNSGHEDAILDELKSNSSHLRITFFL